MSAATPPQQEPDLLEDTTLLRALMEAERGSPEGSLLLAPLRDAAGTITDFECLSANPAAVAILGPAEGETSGWRLRKLLPERDSGGWLARFGRE
jgi:hypothetical protein